MPIRIAHCSDTHGRPSTVRQVANLDVDVILLTGDIVQNKGRVFVAEAWSSGHRIVPHLEIRYQNSWFHKQAKKWARDFRGRPVITVPGNHDFIDVAWWLRRYGVTVYAITDENPCVELLGKRWAGFRQIPWISGEWMGEVRDLAPYVEKALACDPDILVTHGPPAGILDLDSDGDTGYGNEPLVSALAYRPHRITHHFFGHAHGSGCQVVEEMGVYFANGAGGCRVHTIP